VPLLCEQCNPRKAVYGMVAHRTASRLFWASICLCGFFCAWMLISSGMVLTWVSPGQKFVVQTYAGLVCVGWPEREPWHPIAPRPGWDVFRTETRLLWRPHTMVDGYGLRFVSVPLWIPLFACLLGAVWLHRIKRRGMPGPTCANCEYDLTGNVSGVCPECGAKVESATGG
jgi:hypothetical protein